MTQKVEKQKKMIPELRFPGFSGEWEEKRLGEVYSFRVTNSLSRDKLNYESGEIKNIHYGDIHKKFRSHFDLNRERVPFINSGEEPKHSNNNFVECGDLVLADASEDYADIGKGIEVCHVGNQKVLSGLHTLLLKRKCNNVALGFVGHLLKSPTFRLGVKRIAQGTKVLGVSKSYIQKLSFYLPKKTEQKKIAEFLTSVDEWIKNLRSQKESLESYKKGMMQKIFSQEVGFKDEGGEEFGEWEEKRLGEVGEIITGSTPSTKNKKYYGDDFPWITPTDIGAEKDIYVSAKSLTKKGIDKGRFIPKDSLLVTCIASIGKNVVLKVDGSCNQQINSITPNKANIVNFLYFLLEKNKNVLIRFAGAGGMQMLNKKDFSNLKFKIPSLSEQQKIAEFLTSLDKLIESKQKQIVKAEEWKKGLMQGLFV